MISSGWAYLLFTGALCVVLVGIIIHYSFGRPRERVEAPKYRMLEDDDKR
jgi:hypothetical protein